MTSPDSNNELITYVLNASVAAEYDLNVFEANLLPHPKKVDTVSQAVKANHTGIAWHILSEIFSILVNWKPL